MSPTENVDGIRAEDYTCIVINVKQELVLLYTSTETNAIVSTNTSEVNGTLKSLKSTGNCLNVHVTNAYRILLLRLLEKYQQLTISFRSWQLFEYSHLPQTNHQMWMVKTTSKLKKPRYMVLVFQTDLKNNAEKNASEFDHCKVVNARPV